MTIEKAIEYFETHYPFFGAHVLAVKALRALQEIKKNEPQPGLYGKYIVRKSDNGEYVDNCFVLRPDKDKAAVVALRAYAEATDDKMLAADIVNWVGAEKKPLTQSQLRTMNGEMVYCLELNMEVKVMASRRGLISIYYEMPGSNGTFYAKDVTLYRTDQSGG